MKCINCSRELAPGARFCPACGSQQPEQQPEPVAQPTPEQYSQPEQYTQPEQYGYNYEQQYAAPQKKGKKKGVLIVLIIAAVLAIAGGVLGIVFGVRSCTKYDNSNPRAAAQAIVNALNSNDSRALYQVTVPPSAKANLTSMPDYAKLLFTDSAEPEDEVFAMADDALRLIHKKVDCTITFDVKNETVRDGKTVLTGDLSFGNINVGELSVAFAQEDGKWYFADFVDQNLDEQKMISVFGKYLGLFGVSARAKSSSSILSTVPSDYYYDY